jgi:hypothetical protein
VLPGRRASTDPRRASENCQAHRAWTAASFVKSRKRTKTKRKTKATTEKKITKKATSAARNEHRVNSGSLLIVVCRDSIQPQAFEVGANRSSTDVRHNHQFKNRDIREFNPIFLDLAECGKGTEIPLLTHNLSKRASAIWRAPASKFANGCPYRKLDLGKKVEARRANHSGCRPMIASLAAKTGKVSASRAWRIVLVFVISTYIKQGGSQAARRS